MTDRPLLDVRDLRVAYTTRAGEATVIPGVSFQLRAGEALGLVGESGCGKSTVALSIVRYLGRAGRIVGGRVRFEGRELTALDDAGLRAIRGRRIAMVYQDPMASLNPVMTVGRQLMEAPMTHEGVSASAARARALAMLAEVKLADPEAVMARFPHQLSGGQQQRIVIAMALITGPALLIMDEPTTGLDVTVEAAVLDLVRELRSRHRSAILFISQTWAVSCASAIASPSCTEARSSRRVRCDASSASRGIRTRAACSTVCRPWAATSARRRSCRSRARSNRR